MLRGNGQSAARPAARRARLAARRDQGTRRDRRAYRLADLVEAAVRAHHDPAGLPPVLGLVPVAPGQAQAQPPGNAERQHRAGQVTAAMLGLK